MASPAFDREVEEKTQKAISNIEEELGRMGRIPSTLQKRSLVMWNVCLGGGKGHAPLINDLKAHIMTFLMPGSPILPPAQIGRPLATEVNRHEASRHLAEIIEVIRTCSLEGETTYAFMATGTLSRANVYKLVVKELTAKGYQTDWAMTRPADDDFERGIDVLHVTWD